MVAERIPLEPVTSSNLAAYGYNAEKRILAVQFHEGHIFHYAGVPMEKALEFGASDSKGRFYAREIKGKYQAQRMTGTCPQCGSEHGWIGERCTDCGCADYVDARQKAQAS